jgi:glycosyltransferase involved in cell wall biosynthesis
LFNLNGNAVLPPGNICITKEDMENSLISVIVPCYNQAQYLDECLNSVFKQTYSHWECIIVNDGSSDNTDEIAQKWSEKDSRYKYFKKDNGGLSSARNFGLKRANGDYIQFLDSDDIITAGKFEIQLDFFIRKMGDIIISDHVFLKGKKIINHNKYNRDFSLNGLIYGWDNSFVFPPHAALVARNFLLNHNIIFSETLKAKEDYFFWITCALHNAKFYYHNDVLVYYRSHDSGMTKNPQHMIVYNYKVFLEVHELLNERQREIYKDKMPYLLFSKTISLFTPIVLSKSRIYKLGSFLFFVPRFIIRICSHGVHSFKILLKK